MYAGVWFDVNRHLGLKHHLLCTENAITIIKKPSGHTVFHCFHLKLLYILDLFPELHCFTLHNSLFSQRIYLDIAIRSKSYTCTDFTQVYLSC